MAAGVIIGRVAVKVIPDTSRFQEELQRDLDRLELNLDPVEIEINVDTDTVVQEAKRARDKAQDQMKDLTLKVNEANTGSVQDAINKLNRELTRLGEVDLKVGLNEDELKAEMERLDEVLKGIRSIDLEVDIEDPASVKATVDRLNNELKKIKIEPLAISYDEASLTKARDALREKMDETYREIRNNVQSQLRDIQIGMDVDPVKAARTIRKIELILEQIEDLKMTITPDLDERSRFATLRKIQDLRDQVSDMQATIHPDLDSPAALALSARLAVLARDRFVEYVPRMNQAAARTVGTALARMAGARIIAGYMRDLYNSIIQFDKAVPKIIGLSTAVGGLGIVGLTASSNLFALSASLASIAPAALALPGIFAGVGVGVGVTIAALKDFNTIFPDVKEAFSDMQDTISRNFWDEAAGNMRTLIDGALPLLAAGFDKVATASGKFFSSLSASASDRLLPALPGMFDMLAKSIEVARAAADPIVGIISTLGTVGASYLPRLAQWFVDITTQFDNFLKRSTESGEIFTWIDNGVQALKDLYGVGKNALLILSDIADAAQAAGGSSLGMLAAGLERVRDITSSPGFKDGLTEVFRSAHVAMDYITSNAGPGVTNLFKSLGKLIPAILPTIGAAIGEMIGAVADALAQPVVSEGITTMFEGIRVGIANLTPAFAPLARALATMGPLVGELAQTLGKVLGAAIPPVADALVRMGEALEPLIPVMGDLLLSAVEALAPVITNLSNAFVAIMDNGGLQFLTDTMTLLGEVITAIPTSVLTIIAATVLALSVSAMIAGVGMSVLAAATGAFGAALAIVTSPITAIVIAIGLVIAIGYVLIKHWDDIKILAGVVWNEIKNKVSEAWAQIKTSFSEAFSAIKQIASAGWQAIKDFFTNGWTAVKTTTSNAWSQIKTSFSEAWSAIRQVTSAAWEGIKSLFSSAWSAIKSGVDSAWSGIKSAFSSAWSAIQSGVSSAWSTIRSAFTTGMNNAKSAVDTGWNSIKSAFSSAGQAIVNAAKSAWESVKSAFVTGANNAVAEVRALGGKISAAASGFGSLLVSAGRSIVEGLASGIRGAAGAAVQAARDLASSVASAAAGALKINSPSKIFIGIGESVGEGLVDGIVSSTGDVTRAVKNMAESVADAFEMPDMADLNTNLPQTNVRKGLVGGVRTAVTESVDRANGKTLIYNAAPGSSLGSEEDLFAAADRGRMVGW